MSCAVGDYMITSRPIFKGNVHACSLTWLFLTVKRMLTFLNIATHTCGASAHNATRACKCFSMGMFIIVLTVSLADKSFILQFPFERFQLKEASFWRQEWEIFPHWEESIWYWGFTTLCVPLECRNKEKTSYRVCPAMSMMQQRIYVITQIVCGWWTPAIVYNC